MTNCGRTERQHVLAYERFRGYWSSIVNIFFDQCTQDLLFTWAQWCHQLAFPQSSCCILLDIAVMTDHARMIQCLPTAIASNLSMRLQVQHSTRSEGLSSLSRSSRKFASILESRLRAQYPVNG